ncbi:hypothetical protein OAV84_01250 [Schleiferiaceae bacterium]|nr:hypothetical protein [Schleiferiaceae bacterium]
MVLKIQFYSGIPPQKQIILRRFTLLFVLIIAVNQTFAQNAGSVLKQGDWAKVSVSDDAIYMLSPADLESLGLGTPPFESSKLGLYGRSAGVLPERNNVARESDLQPLHIFVEDGGDGQFSGSDRIYFYGQSPHTWVHNSVTGQLDHRHHPYSDEQVYFVTTTEGGARIQNASPLTGGGRVGEPIYACGSS